MLKNVVLPLDKSPILILLLLFLNVAAYSQSLSGGGPTCKGGVRLLEFTGWSGPLEDCSWRVGNVAVPGTNTKNLITFNTAGNIGVSCSCLDPDYPIYDNAGNIVSYGRRVAASTTIPVYGPNNLQLSPISTCDNNATGTITANYLGSIVRWERSYDNVNWEPIASTQNPYPYVESQSAQFRVVVSGDGGCTELISDPAAIVYETTIPGTIVTTGINYSCTNAAGTLSIEGNNGAVLYWEQSTDGNSYMKVLGSDNASSIQVDVATSVKFRAQVRHSSCAAQPTPSVDIAPQNPVGGVLTSSVPPVINCLNSTVTLELQPQTYRGDEFTWEYSEDGVNFVPHSTASGIASTFDLTSQTYFRVKVGYSTNNCSDAYSSVYEVTVKSEGGTPTASPPAQCGINSGLIALNDEVGAVTHWEQSTDGTTWSIVSNSIGKDPLPFTVTQPVNYYKALVQLGTCPPEYSAIVSVNADQVSAGNVRFAGEEKDAERINGVWTFYPSFKLQDHLGNVESWWQYDKSGTTIVNITDTEHKPIVTTTTRYRAQVKNGACDAILSGQATFVVNQSFGGVMEVLGQRIITEYEGNSYIVKTPEGMSIQGGFSFHANTAQEFFVLLDDEYALPSSDLNYVLEETILEEGLTSEDDLYFAPATHRESKYTYFDGLGRQTQQVLRRKSTLQHDVVVPIVYNDLGRVEKEYLPYVASTTNGQHHNTAVGDQQQFYLTPPAKVSNTDYPHSIKKYEASPLGRVLQHGAPGLEWQPDIGHPTQYQYSFNSSNEIRRLSVDVTTEQLIANGFYDAGELNLMMTVDANSLAVREYITKEGLMILKRVQGDGNWFDTYYVYDDLNLLRYVIQPEGVVQLTGNPDQTFLDKWVFQYHYDEKRRLAEKKAPGAGWVYMVYDDLDRLVLTQDGNQRAKNEWGFNKYDVYDRVVVSGLYTFANPADPSQIISRDEIEDLIVPGMLSEQYDGSTPFYGYSNNAFPKENLTVLAVTYYDNYDFTGDIFSNEYTYDPAALEGLPSSYFASVKGSITGQQTRVVDTDTWIKSVTWYNKRYQPIQTLSSNSVGGKDRESRLVDFAGKLKVRSLNHINGTATTTVRETFTYDHNGNLTAHYHKIGDTEVLLKELHYNELGQLVEKNMHRRSNGLPEQSVDYRYNIRGWLTHINNASLTADGITNDDGTDFFGMELHYNSSPVTNAPLQFDGNISEILWKSAGGPVQAYGFEYDNIGRLKHAQYFNLDDPLKNNAFNEQITAYDLNGNIQALQRNGKVSDGVYGPIDHLQYVYNGNTLSSVTEQQTNIVAGFDDANTTGDDYVYDVNGNMKEDKNKGVVIQYNHLNLPSQVGKISGDNLSYGYLASGTKVFQASTEGGVSKRTDYAGQFIYENNVLKYVLHDEGRVLPKSGGWEYQYFIKDHLGNVRITFTSAWESETVSATMEASNAPEEQGEFQGYDAVSKVNASIFDHTRQKDTQYALRLGGSQLDVGLAKTLSVMPGDTVRLKVFGKYVEENDKENWHGALNRAILSVIPATSPGVPVDGMATTLPQSATTPFGQLLASDKAADEGVRAYLNYLVFDKDFKFVNGGYVNLSENAKENGNNVAHEQLTQEIVIDKPGYVYTYLSNEQTNQTAYFDDFTVTQVHSGIIQIEDYYPFGLTFNSYQRENSLKNIFKFQGQEHENGLDLGWVQFKWRNHMPNIGRFFNIDPLGDKFVYNSPYAFSENHVTTHVEFEGLEKVYFQKGLEETKGFNRAYNVQRQTSLGKSFTGSLNYKKTHDVFYYQLAAAANGFTNEVKNKEDFISKIEKGGYFKGLKEGDLDNSFKEGKKVILIAVHGSDVAKDDDKSITEAARILNHEEGSHGLDILYGDKTDTHQDHKKYYGKDCECTGIYSPDSHVIQKDPKYKSSPAKKNYDEIDKIIKDEFNH